MSEKFDVIIVGAGPAGNAAAYTLAKAGLKVLQLERGEYPGSKNVQGAILYANSLERIIPDFREHAPLERHLIEQRMWMMEENSFFGAHYRSEEFNTTPGNRYTIIRARFDKWFSEQAQSAGALLICEMTVKSLLRNEQGRVIGVEVEREDGKIYADAVILADGVNSLLATRAGLRRLIGWRLGAAFKSLARDLFIKPMTDSFSAGVSGFLKSFAGGFAKGGSISPGQ